ncbi:MAG: hypothetical protein COT92_02595 [Candidatus Doudnabacteria bacterium CG10_big_fil_rev_8_21_14_0_10_42_18]|uniref:Uncharacterized protein n=1 Tax=Candidatus Doudnabacteria bacterium CG10_big_fil_rev_8_21_14_0_10_42_18 TaxID=1974552 RepID=A0A2H0VAP4_9BACT|nr:MAG: hypothetical protein COT92_02595 [Candidatus Doudnabacteria bacterium CG10_big_fil_rev_8_21_14_0_10_42_18]
MSHKPIDIAIISSFPPRKCGIASFTNDLTQNIEQLFDPSLKVKIFALNTASSNSFDYPKKVVGQIHNTNLKDYLKAAKIINQSPSIQSVLIQHEFGLFNGKNNSYLQKFIKLLEKPIIIVCHTILPKPKPFAKELFKLFQAKSKALITLTENSRQTLINEYGISKKQIFVIPHGIPSTQFVTNAEKQKIKLNLHLKNKLILTTFGLLNKGKGLEYAIKAVARIIRHKPNLRYLIIGPTHPEVKKREGEKYRNKLIKLVNILGIQKNIKFYNAYQKTSKLLNYLKATDIYLATPLDENQAVSGTLSYALGTGLPVISTAFAHAKEIISEQNGLLIKFKDVADLADALERLILNTPFRNQLAKNAFFSTRDMLWHNVALNYANIILKFIPAKNYNFRKLPKIRIGHLKRLTNKFGVFQFADLFFPNPSYGYTLDDNARALVAATKHFAMTKNKTGLKLANIYLNFIKKSQIKNGSFVNYFHADYSTNHNENEKCSLEDSNARTLYALYATLNENGLPKKIYHKIQSILKHAKPLQQNFRFLRAKAFYVKGLYNFYKIKKQKLTYDQINKNCRQLLLSYQKHKRSNWHWFEPILTYSNSMLSEAMLYGYLVTKNIKYFKIAKLTLEFLVKESFNKNRCVPIGQNGWYKRGGQKTKFDQQPEEVAALVQTLIKMYQITQEKKYFILAHKTFSWFLGNNTLSQFVYDPSTQGCFDGFGQKSLNFNQGAESTISYLLARLALEEPHS